MTTERLSREDDVFLNSELKRMETEIIQTDFPMLPFANGEILPLSTELPAGTQLYAYRIMTKLGLSKIIANPADDLSRVGIDIKEVAGKIVDLGNEFAYSFKDIRASKIAGRPLDSELMMSSKEATHRLFNEIIQFGDSGNGITGLYNNPNITEYAVSTVGTGSPNTAWLVGGVATKTPDQIIADINGVLRSIVTVSKGTKRPNMLLLPLEHYTYIANTPRSATSETTILKWVTDNNPMVKFIALEELNKDRLTDKGILGPDGSSALTGAMMMALTVATDTVKVHIPMPYTIQPMYQVGLEMIKPTEMEVGGTDVRKPFAFAYAKNI